MEIFIVSFVMRVFSVRMRKVVKRVVGLYDDGPVKPFRAVEGTRRRLCTQVLLCRQPGTMWTS